MIDCNLKTMAFLAITSFVFTACQGSLHSTLDEDPTPFSSAPEDPMPPPPVLEDPTPEWSTNPADELDRYNGYLAQAGVNHPDQLGGEKEVPACDVLVHQGSVTFNKGVTKSCTWQQSEPGWVIESARVEVKENAHNRGSYTMSVIAADGQFDMSVKEIGDHWNVAIDLAAKAKDIEVKKKLELAYQNHMERVVSISSNKNSVYLEANANGGLFQSSTIHVVAIAKLIRVQ